MPEAPSRRTSSLLAVTVLLALLTSALVRCDTLLPDDAPVARASWPRTPPPVSPTGAPPTPDRPPLADTPAPPESCDADRRAHEAAVADARVQCEAVLATRGCTPPLPWSAAGRTLASVEEMVARHVEECPALAGRLHLSCTEYPCLLSVRRPDDPTDIDCPLYDALVHKATVEAPPGSAVDPAWLTFAIGGFSGMLKPHVLRRMPHRHAQVARERASARTGTIAGSNAISCSDARAGIVSLAAADPCPALLDAWGCDRQPAAAGPTLADAQRTILESRAVIDRLLDTCDGLTGVDLVLDCERLPCLAAFVAPGDLPWNEVVCGEPTLGPEFHAMGLGDGRTLVSAPILPADLADDDTVVGRWEEEQRFREWLMLERFRGPRVAR